MLSAARDVSEREWARAALAEQRAQLELASRAKERFFSRMSHELRTPLDAVIGFTSLLSMRLPRPPLAERERKLQLVEDSAHQLLALIDELLRVAADRTSAHDGSGGFVGLRARSWCKTEGMKQLRALLLDRAEDALGAIATRALPRRAARYHAYRGNRLDEDQAYALPAGVQRVPAVLGAHVDVPPGHAVFLSARLESRGLGGLRDPWLELCAHDGRRARCYAERGVQARRYLNVSAVAGQRASLTSADLRVQPQGAEWLCFEGAELRAPLLVVAPHPDDAELAAFGLYAERDAWVVTACAGELGTHDYGGLFSHDAEGAALRGRLRVAESLSAPIAGGVPRARIANLGYFDGSLAAMFRAPDAEARSQALPEAALGVFRAAGEAGLLPARERATWQGLVADLVHLLRLSGARTVAFPHPLLDHHPDHAALGMAVLTALERAERGDALLLAYVVHGPGGASGASIHPVGPRDGSVSLPPGQFAEPLFDDLACVPLDAATQRKKALALDTYRDLKDEDGPLPVEALGRRLGRGARELYRALLVYDLGLVRRFLRPNELFYVLDGARLTDWRTRFEAALRRATP